MFIGGLPEDFTLLRKDSGNHPICFLFINVVSGLIS